MEDTGFPCSADVEARVLVLGSMPGRESLRQRQYYAHPRNAFWPIIERLFAIPATDDYAMRLRALRRAGVALWDVAHRCIRPGSMDHAIRIDSVEANDFPAFFASHRYIGHVFFNGRKAAELYRKLVLPQLPNPWHALPVTILPSTSPANARLSFDDKLAAWSRVRQTLETLRNRPYEAPVSSHSQFTDKEHA